MSDFPIVGPGFAGSVPAEPLAMVQRIEKALPRRPTLRLSHGHTAAQTAAATAP